MDNWQLCPKCNGSGERIGFYSGNLSTAACDLCNGTKVISNFTGRPPHKEVIQGTKIIKK